MLRRSDPLHACQANARRGGTDPPRQHEWLYTKAAFQHEHKGKMLTSLKETGHKTGRE